MSEERRSLKLTLIGPERAGKTGLVHRFVHNVFNDDYTWTIGVDFLSKNYEITSRDTAKKVPIKAQIWDTSGQKRYAEISYHYIPGSHAIGIVLALDPNQSLAEARNQLKEQAHNYYKQVIRGCTENTPPICFIINKTDLFPDLDEAQLIEDIKRRLPKNAQHSTLFCSAKTGSRVDEVFEAMGAAAYAHSNHLIKDEVFEAMGAAAYAHSNHLIKQGVESRRISPVILSSPPPPSFPWSQGIIDFIAKHDTWARGNVFLIIAAIVTLVTLASLPIGGIPILFGLSVLAVAGIATGAAFLLWNLGCLIANQWKGGGGGGAAPLTSDDSPIEGWTKIKGSSSNQQQSRPEQYQQFHADPPNTTPAPTGTGQPPIETNKKEL